MAGARAGGRLAAAGAALLGALLLAAPAPRAQQTDVETWAARLVDDPAMARGDLDSAARGWLDMVRAEPGHPLAEGTLRLMGMIQGRAADPTALASAVLALPATGLTPLGARQLEVLQGVNAAARLPVDDPPADLYPGFLSRAFVLGPLPPLGNPLAERERSPEFAEPGFDQPHAGVEGEVRWRPLPRYPLSRGFEPASLFEPARGWALLAFVFDVPHCGPGWIEIGQRRAGAVLPPYAFSLDGGQPVVIEQLHVEGSPISRTFAMLNSGRNRLVIKCPLDAQPELAVRVLDEQGLPWPGLAEVGDLERAGEPLGPADCRVFAQRPAPPADSIAFLSSLPQRGPDSEALLGLLLCHERGA